MRHPMSDDYTPHHCEMCPHHCEMCGLSPSCNLHFGLCERGQAAEEAKP
jgi:hypothetical protein